MNKFNYHRRLASWGYFQNRQQPFFLISSSQGFRANWLTLWVSCDTWPRRNDTSSSLALKADSFFARSILAWFNSDSRWFSSDSHWFRVPFSQLLVIKMHPAITNAIPAQRISVMFSPINMIAKMAVTT